jgi:PAS domain S-box-containing protein
VEQVKDKRKSEGRQREGALNVTNEQLLSLFDSISEGIIITGPDGRITSVNSATVNILGYKTPDELIGKKTIELYYDPKQREAVFVELMEKGFVLDYNLTFKKKDKTPAYTLGSVVLHKDGEGKLLRVEGIFRDTTKQKNAEEALRESEEKYRALIESSTDGVAVHQQGKIVYVNTAAREMLGYEPAEDGTGRNVLDFVHPDYHDTVKARIKTMFETWEPSPPEEEKFLHRDGSAVDVEVFGVPVKCKGEPAVQVVFRDIAERKRVEEALKITYGGLEKRVEERTKQLNLLQSINTAMNIGVSLKDVLQIAVEGVRDIFDYTACDIFLLDGEKENLILSAISTDSSTIKKIEKLTGLTVVGYSVPLAKGSHFTKVVNEMKAQVMDDTVKVFEDFTDNKRLKLLAGPVAKIAGFKSAIMTPLRAENEVIGTIGVASKDSLTVEDAKAIGNFASQIALIIKKGQLEEELRESEERYRSLFENAKDIIFTVSNDGVITSLNPGLKATTGWSREELIGKPFIPLIHPDDSDMIVKKFQNTLEGGTSPPYEVRVKKKSGAYFVGEVRSTPQFRDGKVVAILGIMRDITERKQAEEEMKRRLMKFSLEDGSLYMVKEPTVDLSLRAFADLLNVGYYGLVISRTPEEKFRGRASGNFEFLWLAETDGEKAAPVKLKEIKQGIENMTRKNAVLIDRLDYLIFKEGFEKTLSFVQELRELAYLSGNIFILSIDPSTLEKRKLRLLEKETREIELQSKARLPEDLLEVLSFTYEQNTSGIKPSYSDIGRETGASKPTVRKRVKNLISKGYMTESKKGLYKVVELTDKGRNLFFS